MLEVRFTEVDPAGQIPPLSLGQVQFISESPPARLELEYRLNLPSGAGTSATTDSFQKVILTSAGLYSSAVRASSDPLEIELQLLRNWVKTVRS